MRRQRQIFGSAVLVRALLTRPLLARQLFGCLAVLGAPGDHSRERVALCAEALERTVGAALAITAAHLGLITNGDH